MNDGGNQRPTGKAPAPWSLGDPRVRELREILADTYFNEDAIVDLLRGAHLSPASYNLHGRAHLIWGQLLVEAYAREELDGLLDEVGRDPRAKRWHERIADLRGPSPATDVGGYADDPTRMAKPGARENELQQGAQSTLLDVAFLERGVVKAASVVRLSVLGLRDAEGVARRAYGTGFLIDDKRILTNQHVLFSPAGDPAERVEAWFQYELDVDYKAVQPDVYQCEARTIDGDATHDWAVIELAEPLRKAHPPLTLVPPSKPLEEGDRIYIIQHPKGSYKQIGLHRNVVTLVDKNRIQYMTDTEAGSSGSPVFNDRWEVVALHHCYIAADRPARNALGARGGGAADGVKETGYRNQAVPIGRVLEGFATFGIGAKKS